MSAKPKKRRKRRPPAINAGPAVSIWEPPADPQGWSFLFRRSTVWIIIGIGVIAALALFWPRISLLFSPARPIVNALSQDVVWVDPDIPAGTVDADRIRGIIGQRPLAVVVLAPGNDSFDSALAACTAVTDRIDDVTVMVLQDGALANGCQGDDVPITGGEFGYDFVFWQLMDSQTAFLHGDLPAQVQQLALFYDMQVEIGHLEPRTRTFGAPAAQWALAVGLVVAVTAGVLLLFFGFRRGVVALQQSHERRRKWRAQRDDLDAELQEVALIMLAAEPTGTGINRRQITAAAKVSPAYISALDELTNSSLGTDLTPLRQRIAAIRDKLEAAGRPRSKS